MAFMCGHVRNGLLSDTLQNTIEVDIEGNGLHFIFYYRLSILNNYLFFMGRSDMAQILHYKAEVRWLLVEITGAKQ